MALPPLLFWQESSQLMKATLMRQARQKRASTWDTVDDDGDLVVDKPMTTAREVCTEAAAPRGAALTVSTCANGVQTLKSAPGEDALSGKPVDAASKTPAALVAPAAAAVEGTPGREQASISTPMSGDAWVHDYELEDDLLDLRGYDTKDEAAGETAGETASESADEYAQEHAFLNQENVASAAKKDTGHMEGAKHSANWVVADAAMQQAVSTESASSSTTTTPRATAVDIVTRAEQELRAAIQSGWFLPVNPERLERAIKAAQAQGVCGDLCAQAGEVLQEERRLRAEVEARLRKAKAARATARAAAKAEASVRLQEKMAAKTANLSHVGTTTSTDAGSLPAAKAPSPPTLPKEAMGAPAAAVLSSKASARTSELTLNQVGNASAEAHNRVHKHISFSQQCIWFVALHAAALLFTYISDMPQFVAALDMIDRSLVFMRDGMANCALITWRALPPLLQLLPALDMALLLGL